jgi:hypothetical protein
MIFYASRFILWSGGFRGCRKKPPARPENHARASAPATLTAARAALILSPEMPAKAPPTSAIISLRVGSPSPIRSAAFIFFFFPTAIAAFHNFVFAFN